MSWVLSEGPPLVQSINIADGPEKDAFGLLRTSEPLTIWNSQFQYDLLPLYYDVVVTNNGTVTHNADLASAMLNLTTDSESSAILQSFKYLRYQPGKSTRVDVTFVMAAATTNLDQRVGQFDADNGFFLEQTDSTVNLVRRTKTSGSVVNDKTAQADWSEDTLLGTGPRNPSGITLDLTQNLILHIDYQWLSAGRIRFGFDIGGIIVYVHEIDVSNVLDVPLTTTANLPIRWEAVSRGVLAGGRTMQAICVSVASEGGVADETGLAFTAGNKKTLRTGIGTTAVPVCSIRPALTLNAVTNRLEFELEGIEVFANDSMYWELLYAPGTILGASWGSVDSTHSATEVDVAGTAVTGGVAIAGGFIAANTRSGFAGVKIRAKYPFALDAAGTNQSRGLTLTATTLGGTNKSAAGAIDFVEVR